MARSTGYLRAALHRPANMQHPSIRHLQAGPGAVLPSAAAGDTPDDFDLVTWLAIREAT